jgi:hypothetical protein
MEWAVCSIACSPHLHWACLLEAQSNGSSWSSLRLLKPGASLNIFFWISWAFYCSYRHLTNAE